MDYDVAVIGAGPGGYVAAIKAARNGLKTVLIENEQAGGLCLNWGCIPSKILLKKAHNYRQAQKNIQGQIFSGNLSPDFKKLIEHSRSRIDYIRSGLEQLISANGVELFYGMASFAGTHTLSIVGNKPKTISAKNIIVATGAKPKVLPALPYDGINIITSKEALGLTTQPESIIIVGGGVIGCEMATIFSSLGSKVTIVEYQPQLLWPTVDSDISTALARAFADQGIELKLSARVIGWHRDGTDVYIDIEDQDSARGKIILVAVGTIAQTDGLDLAKAGVELKNDFIKVDPKTYATNVPGIYAIGDVIALPNRPHPALAHVASCEGEIVADVIAKGRASWNIDYENIPLTIFTDPEIGVCGVTEKEARKRFDDFNERIIVQKTQERVMGIAMALEEQYGLTKLMIDSKAFGKIVGAHVIGPSATERIHVFTTARRAEETAYLMANQVLAHPTFSEVFRETLLALDGEAVHVPMFSQVGKKNHK